MKKNRNISYGIALLCALVFISFAAVELGIYALHAPARFLLPLADFLNLPLARINGYTVSIAQYGDEFKLAQTLPESTLLSSSELANGVWNKIIDEYVMRTIADSERITVT